MTDSEPTRDTGALGKPIEDPLPSEISKGPSTLAWRVGSFVVAIVVCGLGLMLGWFDSDPGPDPAEVEGAIMLDTIDSASVSVAVDCPDDANQVEEGETFVCVASRRGRRAELTVTNTEDGFEWATAPLQRLLPRGG